MPVKKPTIFLLGAGAGVALLAAVWVPFALPQGDKGNGVVDDEAGVFVVPGRTQCLPSRKAIIAPTVLHPVTEVLAAPGDKVKKGQVLVKLDDDEPKADLRNKEALLASATIALKEAKRLLAMVESVEKQGVIPARAASTRCARPR